MEYGKCIPAALVRLHQLHTSSLQRTVSHELITNHVNNYMHDNHMTSREAWSHLYALNVLIGGGLSSLTVLGLGKDDVIPV